jgi:hypothetical protein
VIDSDSERTDVVSVESCAGGVLEADEYPGTSLIQCANVWEDTPEAFAMIVADGFRRYSIILVLQEGMAKCSCR